jgi:hypothetical protein
MSDDETHRRAVRRSSDKILEAVDDLRAAERRKRQLQMSSPEFHELADEVKRKADAVWREAAMEAVEGDALTTTSSITTEEVPPDKDV